MSLHPLTFPSDCMMRFYLSVSSAPTDIRMWLLTPCRPAMVSYCAGPPLTWALATGPTRTAGHLTKQGQPERITSSCTDAHCVPDTPPDAPSSPVASLTPSALALLQPAASSHTAALQQAGLYAPPSLFPGFATREKVDSVQPGPSTNQPIPQQLSGDGQQGQRGPCVAKDAMGCSAHGSGEPRALSGAACHSMGPFSAQDNGGSMSWAGASSGSTHQRDMPAPGKNHSPVRPSRTCEARLGSSASSGQQAQHSRCPDPACQAPKQRGSLARQWAEQGSSPPARPAVQPSLQQHKLTEETQHSSGGALLEASIHADFLLGLR